MIAVNVNHHLIPYTAIYSISTKSCLLLKQQYKQLKKTQKVEWMTEDNIIMSNNCSHAIQGYVREKSLCVCAHREQLLCLQTVDRTLEISKKCKPISK